MEICIFKFFNSSMYFFESNFFFLLKFVILHRDIYDKLYAFSLIDYYTIIFFDYTEIFYNIIKKRK